MVALGAVAATCLKAVDKFEFSLSTVSYCYPSRSSVVPVFNVL